MAATAAVENILAHQSPSHRFSNPAAEHDTVYHAKGRLIFRARFPADVRNPNIDATFASECFHDCF